MKEKVTYSGFRRTNGIWNPLITLYSGGTSEKFKVGESFSRLWKYDLFIKKKKEGVVYIILDPFNTRHCSFVFRNKKYDIFASWFSDVWKVIVDDKPFLFLKKGMYKEGVGYSIVILNAKEKKIGTIILPRAIPIITVPFYVTFERAKDKIPATEMLGILTTILAPF